MLVFNLEDGKQVLIDRAAVEEKLLVSIFDKLEEARHKDAGMYSVLKSAVNTVLMFAKIDIKVPKGENSLEYLIAHYASLGLDALEGAPLNVSGKVVEPTHDQEH